MFEARTMQQCATLLLREGSRRLTVVAPRVLLLELHVPCSLLTISLELDHGGAI